MTEAVRVATPADASAILDVMVRAYSIPPNSARRRATEIEVLGHPERHLVLEREGRVVAALRVLPDWLRVGRSTFLKGDVGHVAVLPDLQGQGIGTRLMQGCVRWLRQESYDAARLGGLLRFYRRFGWAPFPRRFYEFTLLPVRAKGTFVPAEVCFALSPERAALVRHYQPERDSRAVEALYQRFNTERTGSLVRDQAAPSAPGSRGAASVVLRLVYEHAGVVTGYLFAGAYPLDTTAVERDLTVSDVAYDVTMPQALSTLVRFACLQALELGAQRVLMQLPFDPVVMQALIDDGVGFALHELQGAPAGNMIAVVNLTSLLTRLLPELQERYRVARVSWQGMLHCAVDDQQAFLLVDRQLAVLEGVAAPDREAATLQCDTATWMKLVLGLHSFAELLPMMGQTLPPGALAVCQALFPRQPTASGPWG